MIRKVSTPDPERAIIRESPVPNVSHRPEVQMIRIFLAVIAAGLIILVGGILMLGAFPPTPQPHPVEKVVPNDKFSTH
jgi:hypothetical protein